MSLVLDLGRSRTKERSDPNDERSASTCLLSLFTVCIPVAAKEMISPLRTLEERSNRTSSVERQQLVKGCRYNEREYEVKTTAAVEALGETFTPPLLLSPLQMAFWDACVSC